MKRLALMFLCAEWIPLLHWRPGLAYAFTLTAAYVPKTFLLAQMPQTPLYAAFLHVSQMAFALQCLIAALSTLLLGHDTAHPGSSALSFLRAPRFTWLILEPLIALGFALLCAASLVGGAAPVLLSVLDGQPLMLPEAYRFWEAAGGEGRFLAVLLVPLASAFFLRRYNRLLYDHSDLGFADAAGMGGTRGKPRPPAGAMIAGSAIAFPKVSAAAPKAAAPSLEQIGRRFPEGRTPLP